MNLTSKRVKVQAAESENAKWLYGWVSLHNSAPRSGQKVPVIEKVFEKNHSYIRCRLKYMF